MATKPLQDNTSGPDTEYSQGESIQDLEPVLVLRTAKSLILPLRIPDRWKELPFAAAPPTRSTAAFPIVAFKATTHVLDPGTQRTHTITLAIKPSIDDDANIFLLSDSIAKEGSWRAHLYRGTDLRASVPFVDGQVELHRGLSAGSYTIKLTSADKPILPAFTISIEHFNLPEALQVSETYLAERQYIRAEAVLSDATERYPENADAQDLLVLAETLATADPAAYQKEQAEFGVTRSRNDTSGHLRELLASTKAKFGKRMASIFAARSLDRAAIPDEVITKIAQETASVVVLQVMAALKEHLEARDAGLKDKILEQALDGVTQRLVGVDVLRRELADRINLMRQDTLKSVDEKFGLVCDALKRYENAVAQIPAAPPDYGPFFRERLGQACWSWIGGDYQNMFIAAENHYRREVDKPNIRDADFTEGLLQYCRAFEFLLKDKLGGLCKGIQNTITKSSELYRLVLEKLSAPEELELALDQDRSLSMTRVAAILHVGKVLQVARPGALSGDAAALLACSPGPTDIEQIAALCYIAVKLRNGKVHKRSVTDVREMRMLRKLGLGLDEERVSHNQVTEWIKSNPWFENEAAETRDRLARNWPELTGFVPMVWRASKQGASVGKLS